MINSNHIDLAANAFGLVGVFLLAAPAFYAAKYGRLAYRARITGPINPADADLVRTHKEAMENLQTHQNNWTPLLGRCLVAGTICSGINNLLGLIKGIVF